MIDKMTTHLNADTVKAFELAGTLVEHGLALTRAQLDLVESLTAAVGSDGRALLAATEPSELPQAWSVAINNGTRSGIDAVSCYFKNLLDFQGQMIRLFDDEFTQFGRRYLKEIGEASQGSTTLLSLAQGEVARATRRSAAGESSGTRSRKAA